MIINTSPPVTSHMESMALVSADGINVVSV